MRSAEQDDFAPNPWKARALAAEATAEKLRERLEASNREARDGAKAAYHWMSRATALGEQRDRLREALRKIEQTWGASTAPMLSDSTKMRDIARAALSDSDSNCEHEWKDARNKVTVSGEWCPKCGAVRAGNAATGDSNTEGER